MPGGAKSRDEWEAAVTAKLGMIGAQLASMDEKLGAVGKIPELVEQALKAVATESQNAAGIVELRHRIALLEQKMESLSTPLAS